MAWDDIYEPTLPYETGVGWRVLPDSSGAYVGGQVDLFYGEQVSAGLVARYDDAGNVQWSKTIGGFGVEGSGGNYGFVYGLAGDGRGGVYAAGYTSRSVFEPVDLRQQAFVTRLDSAGNTLWGRALVLPEDATANGVAARPSGGVVVAAVKTQYQPGRFFDELIAADLVLAEVADNGDLLWQRAYATADNEYVFDVAIDAAGAIYTVSAVSEGPTSPYLINEQVRVRKLSPAGDPVWSTTLNSGGLDTATRLRVAGDGVYLAGGTTGVINGVAVDDGVGDAFLAKLDTDGGINYIRQYDSGAVSSAIDFVIADNGELYLIGSTIVGNFTSNYVENYTDLQVLHVAADGTLLETHEIDVSNYDRFYGASLLGDSLYATGFALRQVEDGGLVSQEISPYIVRYTVPEPGSAVVVALTCGLLLIRRHDRCA